MKIEIRNKDGNNMRLSKADERIIKRQPGYQRQRLNKLTFLATPEMRLMRSVNGGIRLYVAVSGQWMDGSLADMTGLQHKVI